MACAFLTPSAVDVFFGAMQLRLQQGGGESAPYRGHRMLPYVLSILAPGLVARRTSCPQALMKCDVRAKGVLAALLVDCVPGPDSPERFYRRGGFRHTGKVDEGEVAVELSLARSAG